MRWSKLHSHMIGRLSDSSSDGRRPIRGKIEAPLPRVIDGEAGPQEPASPHCLARPSWPHETFLAAGGVHVPSRIDGFVSLGQYMRNIRMKSPAGAGSQ